MSEGVAAVKEAGYQLGKRRHREENCAWTTEVITEVADDRWQDLQHPAPT